MSKGERDYPLVAVYTAEMYGQTVLVRRFASVPSAPGGTQFEDRGPPEVDPLQAEGYLDGEGEEI